MRIKTKSELLATGKYHDTGITAIGLRHNDGSWIREDIMGRRITHNNAPFYQVEGAGEWHLNPDCIDYKEDTVLKILAKVDAL